MVGNPVRTLNPVPCERSEAAFSHPLDSAPVFEVSPTRRARLRYGSDVANRACGKDSLRSEERGQETSNIERRSEVAAFRASVACSTLSGG